MRLISIKRLHFKSLALLKARSTNKFHLASSLHILSTSLKLVLPDPPSPQTVPTYFLTWWPVSMLTTPVSGGFSQWQSNCYQKSDKGCGNLYISFIRSMNHRAEPRTTTTYQNSSWFRFPLILKGHDRRLPWKDREFPFMITHVQKASKDSWELWNDSDDPFPLTKRAKMLAQSEETGDEQ